MRIGELADGSYIETDPDLLDRDRLHHWLSTDAYWALGRTREQLDRSIAGSTSFGLYSDANEQIGYARAVTDFATFVWLCDVYLDRTVRGRGLGTWLVRTVCEHLTQFGPRRVLLATADAHEIYSRVGFTPLAQPETLDGTASRHLTVPAPDRCSPEQRPGNSPPCLSGRDVAARCRPLDAVQRERCRSA